MRGSFIPDRDTRFAVGDEVVLHPDLDDEDHAEFKAHDGLEPGKKYRIIEAEDVAGYQQITVNNGIDNIVLISGWFAPA